jgi:hypothetical protein
VAPVDGGPPRVQCTPMPKKPGPKKGSRSAKRHGRQGGKSRPSLKKGAHKKGARHGRRRGK